MSTRLTSLLALLLLSACSSSPPSRPNQDASPLAGYLAALRANLPGVYFVTDAQNKNRGRLQIRRLPQTNSDVYLLHQDQVTPQIIWLSAVETGLKLEFAPLRNHLSIPETDWVASAKANIQNGCSALLLEAKDGLRGQTNPDSCRFTDSQQGTTIRLIKEWAFTGNQISLAERLLDDARQPLGPDRIVHFHPLLQYKGWAGVSAGKSTTPERNDWILARPFTVNNDGVLIELINAADESMHYSVKLDSNEQRRTGPMLKLSVIDNTGATIAQSWAAPESRKIGINLGWLQVGLERSD